MKRYSSLAIAFLFSMVLSVAVSGQTAVPANRAAVTPPQTAQPGATKIGWIDTQAFGDEKEGVTRYIAAYKDLSAQMKPRTTELEGIKNKLEILSREIETMTKNTAVPVNQTTLQAKQEEGQRLQREGEFKQKDLEAALQSASARVLGPVSADIGKAIQEFAKQKGYAVVLDIAALANANAILVLDPSMNITKEFIAYYNTRPATTATTAAPR